ncbi:Spy/CpxP family protein refolding chaperone [Echinimonas agarilytica]|uniref:Spy/CpxP family protein refolding chaperone n=1 Tax=Echinimonas agarilytica TaxID=1215918 RepID=A0AA42B8M7_9GAMM|nr:Spy/CpxP family protein refolding chaperone [Echinimonas agarilytica]MCM2681052.1 Spy/CpxP family protein refolding chaperone [Echinimonas agarilytica]
MNTKMLFVTLACTLSLLANYAIAKPNDQRQMRQVFKSLDLTDAQKTELQKVKETFKAERPEKGQEERQSQRETHKAEMKQLMQQSSFDEVQAQQIIEQRAEKHQQKALTRMKMHHAMMQVLTPEQQEQFIAEMEKRKDKTRKGGKNKNKNQA